MRNVHILIIFLILLISLAILFGHEALASLEIPNMTETEPPSGFSPTPDLYTEPIPLDKLAMSALFVPDASFPPEAGWYRMTAFGLNLTPNSQLCPGSNCRFGFEYGYLLPNTSAGGYILLGELKVASRQATGMSSQTYQLRGDLDIVKTIEQTGNITHFLTDGELKIGRGIVIYGGEFDYRITNGSLIFKPGQASLVFIGERYHALDKQSQSTNFAALAQPVNAPALPANSSMGDLTRSVNALGNSLFTAKGPWGEFSIQLRDAGPWILTLANNTSAWASEVERIANDLKQMVFEPGGFPPPNQPNQLIILSQSSYIDNIGSVHIVGEVLNQAPVTANFVKIIATLYNGNGQVVGTDFTYADPSELAPGQRAPFDIIVSQGSVPMYQMSSYGLTVDSQ